jgi:catechol 2,3-dioxygenase-like lactoylglutathione lyase family enzyme
MLNHRTSTTRAVTPLLIGVVSWLTSLASTSQAADLRLVNIAVPSPAEAVRWYTQHLDCVLLAERSNAVSCAGVELEMIPQATLGGSQGTGVDHIAFSVADLAAKMQELEAVGVGGQGVRLQRFDDGTLFHAVAGLGKSGFIFDPWGTSIELVEEPTRLGFHHIHLSATDPAATLAFYRDTFAGVPASLGDDLSGLQFGAVWLFVAPHTSVAPAPTAGRAIAYIGFVVDDIAASAALVGEHGFTLAQPPAVPAAGRSAAQQAFVLGPDRVQLALVETGWAGIDPAVSTTEQILAPLASYTVPRTPWGEPDLQGIWTGDAADGIPLERPRDVTATADLSEEEAAARRERSTLRSIWGYEREWRDTTLGYAKRLPLTQVAMIIDPPDGRLPPRTPAAAALVAAAADNEPTAPTGPQDLNSWVRCITQGLPNLMMPTVYNNGLQIIQGPHTVAIQKEMIHETRIIPINGNPHLQPELTQWLGDSRGWWEGDTLVVEVTNFNGRVSYQGSSKNMKLTERFTRIAPDLLEYEFTVDDPTVWTQPWTAVFPFVRDDAQYELVEYACHEGNYAMTNILNGASAGE